MGDGGAEEEEGSVDMATDGMFAWMQPDELIHSYQGAWGC